MGKLLPRNPCRRDWHLIRGPVEQPYHGENAHGQFRFQLYEIGLEELGQTRISIELTVGHDRDQ